MISYTVKNPCNRAYDNEVKHYESLGYQYSIKDNHVLCMADDTFNGESAAHIIWQAAQDYSINPQVLIVLLEKEQSLVTDPWPNHRQYAKATGFACPDTGGCDAKDAGFKNQIRKAAALFREVLDGGWSNYPAYTTQFIYYNPSASCGGSNIYIQNRATSALYRYTPYQPNSAALAAGTGTGDSCSSYGNRNFYNLFTEWFGNANGYPVYGAIRDRQNQLNNSQTKIGEAVAYENCNNGPTECFQQFQNGYILWKNTTGAWESKGSIRVRYGQLGYEHGILGYPTGHETPSVRGGTYQAYENGYILGGTSTSNGFWENKGEIRVRYGKLDYEHGEMGYPTGPEQTSGDDIWWQMFENGAIIGSGRTGFWENKGKIRERWAELGFQTGKMGLPTGPEQTSGDDIWWQMFENGAIIGSGRTGFWENKGKIRERWAELGFQTGKMGLPTGPEQTSGDDIWWQMFENGAIIGSGRTGFWENYGDIRSKWAELGFQNGVAGLPIGPTVCSDSTCSQKFEHGIITETNGETVFKQY